MHTPGPRKVETDEGETYDIRSVANTNAAAPYQIILADFEIHDDSAVWVIGRVIENKATSLRAEIGELGPRGWWIYRLTQSGQRAQKVDRTGTPKAFLLFPVIACSEWCYVTPRPGVKRDGCWEYPENRRRCGKHNRDLTECILPPSGGKEPKP